jgi:excisionase family DNA binding protein
MAITKLLLVGVKESARLLGISPRTLHRVMSAGILPRVHVGRRTLLRASDLIKFAENGVSVEKLKRVVRGVGA